jgi:copper transport protein
VYAVAWRTVSKVDGHLAAGTFAFGVGVAPASAAASGVTVARAPGPSLANLVARWVFYVGLMFLVGGSVVALVCFGSARRFLTVVGLGAVAAVVGAVGLASEQLHSAGLGESRLFDSPFSHHLLERVVPLGVAGLAVVAAVALRRPALRSLALAAAGAAGLVSMWGDVEASHVAASHTFRTARMVSQCAHFAAAGIWVGGLVTVLVGIRGMKAVDRPKAVHRFSTLALVAVAVIAATGTQRAFDEVHGLHRLIDTSFGRWVLVKSVLLVALIGFGAINRYRAIPSFARGVPRTLRVVIRSELGLISVVLVATAFLQGLAPPASVASPSSASRPLVLNAHDFGTTMRVQLSVTPDAVGFNRFHVMIRDYDNGAPVDAQGVTLRFALGERPDLGQSTLRLKRDASGVYTGNSANLAIDGTWTVTVIVQRSSGGTEIPLSVTTRQPPERIDVQRNGALPTIYTLHLPEGRSLQSYLDPGHRDIHLNEFHVTAIGPDGNELAVADVSVTATSPGTHVAIPLTVRRLDPLGHFVADLVDAKTGSYRFAVVATTKDGEALQGHFTVAVT